MKKKTVLILLAATLLAAPHTFASQMPGEYTLTGEPINTAVTTISNFSSAHILYGRKAYPVRNNEAEYIWNSGERVWSGIVREQPDGAKDGLFDSGDAVARLSTTRIESEGTFAVHGTVKYSPDKGRTFTATLNGGGESEKERYHILFRGDGMEIGMTYLVDAGNVELKYSVREEGREIKNGSVEYEFEEPLIIADIDYIVKNL